MDDYHLGVLFIKVGVFDDTKGGSCTCLFDASIIVSVFHFLLRGPLLVRVPIMGTESLHHQMTMRTELTHHQMARIRVGNGEGHRVEVEAAVGVGVGVEAEAENAHGLIIKMWPTDLGPGVEVEALHRAGIQTDVNGGIIVQTEGASVMIIQGTDTAIIVVEVDTTAIMAKV